MYYEINVSLNGQHYFATHERSITYEARAFSMVANFKQAFPASEGYNVSLTYWEQSGQEIDVSEIGNDASLNIDDDLNCDTCGQYLGC